MRETLRENRQTDRERERETGLPLKIKRDTADGQKRVISIPFCDFLSERKRVASIGKGQQVWARAASTGKEQQEGKGLQGEGRTEDIGKR